MLKAVASSVITLLCRAFIACLAVFSGFAFGQCSEYMGRAAINEISTVHNWKLNYGDFIEAKLLDSSIPTSITDEWSLMICSDTCNWAHLSTFTKTDSYFVRDNSFVWGFISWRTSFDVILRDKWGYTIDYVSVNGNSALSPACTVSYDSTATSGSSTRRTRRVPDGSGDWDTPSGNSEPASEGASNVTPPAGAATLAISDATATQGSTMTFNLSIPGNTYSVDIQYSTFDGTAVAGTDYTNTTGSINIPAGTTSATITVPILSSGATSDKDFYLLLDSVTNANAPDQVAIGTITAASAGVDHYRIEYDGSALTCQSETLTVKACANADCSSLYTSVSTGILNVSTPEPMSVNSALEFTGSTTITVAETTPTTVTMALNSTSPAASLKCYSNGTLDGTCSYTTTDTGFIIYSNTVDTLIPTQIAGKASDTGYGSSTITLQAVQTNTTTGTCSALFADNTLTSVDLAIQCEDPGTCSSTFTVGNLNEIPNPDVLNSFNLSKYDTYSSHNLYFKTDSKATININYADVGKVKLHAKKTVNLGGDTGQNQSKTLTGNSNSFYVRPFGFYVNISGNPAASDNTGGHFKKAGEAFDVSVTAVQWASGDDGNTDGIPDSNSVLSNNAATPNFGQESTAETVTISHTLVSPSGGIVGSLSNNSFSNFTNGVASNTGSGGMSWNDVGIISMSAAGDGNYMASGVNVTTPVGNVGRFVPSHFRLLSSSLTQSCSSAFSYMGQDFSLAFNVAAQGVGDISLSNYDSGSGTDYHGLASWSVVLENSDNGTDLASRLSAISHSWTDGVINQTFTPNFTRLTVSPWIDGPFDNAFVGLKIDDGDTYATVSLIDNVGTGTNMNATMSSACVVGSTCDAMKLHASEVKFRYGRMNSKQVYGSASESLSLPLFTEYFDGSSFVTNTLDSCSSILASEVNMSGAAASPFNSTYVVKNLDNDTTVGSTTVDTTPSNTSSTTLSALSGEFDLTLTAPTFSSGSTGYVPVYVDLTNYSWLQFDWDTGGSGATETVLPTQNVSFGLFSGNDRVISWREKR